MSQLQIPISGMLLFSTGDVRLFADIDLLLKDASGNWKPERFRVDTGTEVTTFPAHDAKGLALPMPQQPSPGASHTQTGLEIRSGYIRFRVDGMDPTEYVVACLFLGDPDTPPDPTQPATFPRKLLQPFSLLDQLRFTIAKAPYDGTPYGKLTVDKK